MGEPHVLTEGAAARHTRASGDAASQIKVLGVRIRVMTTALALDTISNFMVDSGPHSVFIVNAATANLAFEDSLYRDCLNRAHLVLNDGTGIRWAARSRGIRLTHNHVGTDLIPAICSACEAWPLRVFVFGGQVGSAERAAGTLLKRFPKVEIVGCRHGYTSPAEDETVCRMINAARPHLVIVAMGNPLQEQWIDRNLHRLERGVAVGVGGLVDHLAGDLRRAPLWVRKAGFEWCQILAQQPHKWRRYILGNPRFLYRVAREVLRERRS